MEDILAIAVVVAGVVLATLAIRAQWRLYKRRQQTKAEELARKQKAADEYWAKRREQSRKAAVVNSKPLPPKQVTPTRSYTSTTDTTTVDNSFVNGMLTQMLIDTTIDAIRHGTDPDTGKVYDREVERSVGVTKTESSWGFDDADSRKSVSSSMENSWSSSDSFSSSSDSGPSSDW
jgi:hypothetical protein